jgi:hypothetical protein
MNTVWIWLWVVSVAVFVSGTEVHAAFRTAASCSYSDVSTAVMRASARDTVIVPAGICSWANTLAITTGINLIGSGIGNTVIKNGIASHVALITYRPTSYKVNDPFRISGFTFDLGRNGGGIELGISNKNAPFPVQTRIRIDHNRFTNAPNLTYQAIWDFGGMYGAVDNNIFDGIGYPVRHSPQVGGASWWDNFTMTFGASNDHLYFEDNIFDVETFADCQYSGRYLYRYNTITVNMDQYPFFDMHGNQSSGGRTGAVDGMYSCFGGEIYGNDIRAGSSEVNFLDQRGGKALVFYNNVATSSSVMFIKVREENPDSEEPTTSTQPQHVSNSFFWNNRKNLNQSLLAVYPTQLIGDIPLANRDFWAQGDTFNGTSGVGCGTLASRPSTCTTGVGYWATNQSCSDLTGLVGANPTTPISGTLYKCTATNTWTAYYTPYTYPHPLRYGGSSEVSPPGNLRIISSN